MKKVSRAIAVILSVLMLISPLAVSAAEKKADNDAVLTAEEYNSYMSGVYSDIVAAGGIVAELDKTLEKEGAEISFTVPTDGTYVLGMAYSTANHIASKVEVSFKLDGADLFGGELVELDKICQDVGGIRTDSKGNQFAAEQGAFVYNAFMYPLNKDTFETYTVSLTAGEHKIFIASLNDEIFVEKIALKPQKALASYKAPTDAAKNYKGEAIIQEGETALWKSNSWLVAQADNSSWNVTPEDPMVNKVNYIGGNNWSDNGATITWAITIPEDGYYKMGFAYRQSLVVNYSSYRKLLIDGECPFKEVENIAFPYTTGWDRLNLEDKDGNPYMFYLEKGIHTFALQVTLGDYGAICEELEDIVADLGNLNLKMTMITGETVDISRDYDLFAYIPDLEERFKKDVADLKRLEDKIIEISGGESSSYALVLRNMRQSINQMLNNKFTAANYKSDFYTNYSSLSVCLTDMQSMPMDLDQIIIGSVDDEESFEPKGGFIGFFKSIWFSIRRFVASFANDYRTFDKKSENSLTLWVNWGQDQARVLNSLAKSSFTADTGIEVEVQVVNATVVQAILSGNGPDLVLQHSRTEPVNLAMRGALYDLSNFKDKDPDYDKVLAQFADGATTPYYYNGGLYGLPDTQNYDVLFYRTDILEELKIKVPETWDEFKGAAEILLHNNLSAYIPYTQIAATTTVNVGVGGLTAYPTLLMQSGIDLYTKDGKKSNLTTPEALNVFAEWTSFYTELKIPTQMNFYNRFRSGTTPIGVAPYNTAITISTEAPELEGKWAMALTPGTVREDGTIDHTVSGSGTACSILNISKNKDAAWKFLKWWTSDETQTKYSTNVESILGPLGRVMVSNTEALKNLSWSEAELDVILEQREWLKEVPEMPGSYQVSRSIDMAFYNVINNHVNPKDILTEWGRNADNEIARKWKQYTNRGK